MEITSFFKAVDPDDKSKKTEKYNNHFKFIHASDIHLGTAQYSNNSRADDFIWAFNQILNITIEQRADFLLLGGDVFTSLEMLPGKFLKILEILQIFHECTKNKVPIICIEGNHDIRRFSRGTRFEKRGQSWLKVLSNLGLIVLLDASFDSPPNQLFPKYDFSLRKGGKIRIKDAMIYGTRYLGEKPISELSKIRKAIDKDNRCFKILIQHFGIEGQMENVPGIKLDYVEPLRHRIHYLALGHFHKQYIINNWIYNPGSSEATCSIDNSFKRGVFLVEVERIEDDYEKKVTTVRLQNRSYIWSTIRLTTYFKNREEIYSNIIKALKERLRLTPIHSNQTNLREPVLYLKLCGKQPSNQSKINKKSLIQKIVDNFPVVDCRIYEKYDNRSVSIVNYIN